MAKKSKRKKTTKSSGKAPRTRRVLSSQKESEMESSKASQQSSNNTGSSNESTAKASESKTNLYVRRALRVAFEYKDKVMGSKPVQNSWETATHTLQSVLDKNPKVSEGLGKIDARLKVSQKLGQALVIAKLVEMEIRQKL